jgi:transposase
MQYIQGNNRNQTCFITLDDQLAADNPVRLMDAFIDKLDLQKLVSVKPYLTVKAVRPMPRKYF